MYFTPKKPSKIERFCIRFLIKELKKVNKGGGFQLQLQQIFAV